MSGNRQPPTAHNLPPSDGRRLFGRNEQRLLLHKWIRGEEGKKYHIFVIHGEPGIGKTELAVHVAHDCWKTDDYLLTESPVSTTNPFKVFIFVQVKLADSRGSISSLTGRSDKAPVISHIFREIAQALGRSEILTWDALEQEKLIYQAFEEQETLLILDSLDAMTFDASSPLDRESIYLFLRNIPSTVKVIITSKQVHPLFLALCDSLHLQGLAEQDAIDLAKSVNPEINDEQATALCASTGGNPFAIELGAVIHVYPSGKEGDLTDRSKSLSQAVTRAVDNLDDWIERSVLLAFNCFEDHAGVRSLAMTAGIDQKSCSDAIDKLSKYLLVRKRPDLDRVESDDLRVELYHSSIKEKVSQLFEAQEKFADEAIDRWISYYVTLRSDKEAGWTIFSDYKPDEKNFKPEMQNIFKVIDYCLETNPTKWRSAVQIVDNYRESFFSLGFWQERIDYCIRLVEIARQEGDYILLAKVERLLAWMYCFRSAYPKAEEMASDALEISNLKIADLRDPNEKEICRQTQYKAHNTLGQIALRKRELPKAREAFSEALRIVALNHPEEAFAICFHLAEVEYEKLKDMQRDLVDMYSRGEYAAVRRNWEMDMQARWHQLTGTFETIRSRAINANPPHKRAEAHMLYYLGKVSRRGQKPGIKDLSKARELFNKSLDIAKSYNDNVLRARIWLAQAQLEEADGNKREATLLIESAYRELWNFQMRKEYEDTENFMRKRLEISQERIEELRIRPLPPEDREFALEYAKTFSKNLLRITFPDLQSAIKVNFSMSDLQGLCFESGFVDWEDVLRNDGKTTTIVSLIQYCERLNRRNDLLGLLNKARPGVNWYSLP
jgi:tetratricopeptide (TPR) repeat protein